MIVIWLLIVTLAVLCKKKQNQNDYDFTKNDTDDDEEEKNDFVNETGKYQAKDNQDYNDYKDEPPDKESLNDANAPDVVQTVKLWYV